MDNKRETDLWKQIDRLIFIIALLGLIILVGAYFFVTNMKNIDSASRDLILSVITNIIPTSLLFIGAYLVFRHIEKLRSERDSDELADKVVLRLLEIAKIQASTPRENSNFLDDLPEISELYLKLSRELDVAVKPFESKANPQKIVVECNYRGTSNIRIKKITYSGSKLSVKEDVSDIYKLDGLSALLSEDKVDLSSGGKHTIDLVLAKKATKWNKTIESWYGKLGYLYFEIEYGNEVVNLQKQI